MIHEVIVTTINKDKKVHIAPMGVKILQSDSKKYVQISPFKPSQTLNNILETKIPFLDRKSLANIIASLHNSPV